MTACAEYLHPPEMQKRCESQIPHWLFFERGSRFPYFLLMTVTSQRAGSRTAGASVAWGLDTSQTEMSPEGRLAAWPGPSPWWTLHWAPDW